MAQYKQTEENINFDDLDIEEVSQDVVNITNYKQSEENEGVEASAFEKVMSQMNIADRSDFDNQYKQLWKEASNGNELLSVFMCEIDFFKAYLSNYGEQGSSFMLLVIGLALKATCEKHDCFLAHYQEQEFGILMKGGDQEKALEVAEFLRQAVEESRTEHKYSSVSDVVTLSIGMSCTYPNSIQMLMRKVDGALHDAKSSGRNQVCGAFPDEDVLVEQVSQENDADQAEFLEFMENLEIASVQTFDNDCKSIWKECCAEQELLSMFVCEFDFFQAYRDKYGKQASNDALLIVACALRQTCAQYGGLIYHFGDEKFAVLLKGGNATNALRVSKSLHQFIAESSTEHNYSEVSNLMTVSVGLSSVFPDQNNAMKMLIAETEKALSEAIKSGRNQTSVI